MDQGAEDVLNTGKVKLLLGTILIVILIFTIFSTSMAVGQGESLWEIKEKLEGISDKEREVLQYLFILVQEIEEMEREEEKLNQEIGITNGEIKDLEALIAAEEKAYDKKREELKQVLNSYQRRGPGTFLEIILDSESLSMLLRRINTLRDLTHNTGKLLEQLEESKEKLSMEKARLSSKLDNLKDNQEALRETLASKWKIREDMENYLASFEEEREYYQEHLANLQQVWDQLKPLFYDMTREFSRIIEEGNIPDDALKVSFGFFRIKGTLDQETFNQIISEHPNLPEIVFNFYSGKIEMRLPEQNLIMIGKFVVEEGQILKFEVTEGSFYGLPLETAAIEDLFRDGYMIVNLKPLVGDHILHSIEILDGYLELLIIPVLS